MKKITTEINVTDLKIWLAETDVQYAFSSREHKRLVAKLDGTFRIAVAHQQVFRGPNLNLAVEIYNSITEEYVN